MDNLCALGGAEHPGRNHPVFCLLVAMVMTVMDLIPLVCAGQHGNTHVVLNINYIWHYFCPVFSSSSALPLLLLLLLCCFFISFFLIVGVQSIQCWDEATAFPCIPLKPSDTLILLSGSVYRHNRPHRIGLEINASLSHFIWNGIVIKLPHAHAHRDGVGFGEWTLCYYFPSIHNHHDENSPAHAPANSPGCFVHLWCVLKTIWWQYSVRPLPALFMGGIINGQASMVEHLPWWAAAVVRVGKHQEGEKSFSQTTVMLEQWAAGDCQVGRRADSKQLTLTLTSFIRDGWVLPVLSLTLSIATVAIQRVTVRWWASDHRPVELIESLITDVWLWTSIDIYLCCTIPKIKDNKWGVAPMTLVCSLTTAG